MSVILFLAGAAVGFGCCWLGGVAVRSMRKSESAMESLILEYRNELKDVERMWKPSGVGLGYSIDMVTGEADVSIRVPNCGEDVVFRLATPNVTRRKRGVAETLGIATELPPSLQ